MKKQVPKFNSEAEEREFWLSHDTTEFMDWSDAEKVTFPNLKPSSKTISLRLPESMLNEIKIMANKRDVPYQSLIKILLSEKIQEEKDRKKKAA